MSVRLPIGEFSRMTYLSIRALRFYHEAGILVPATVDPATGYRYYAPAQLPVAQVIRRLRDLQMPLEEIGTVVAAPDVAARNAAIGAHLGRMQAQLAATQATVASLQALLEQPADRPADRPAIEHRSVAATRVLSIGGEVTMDGLEDWWSAAFEELDEALRRQRVGRDGLAGALYHKEFFELEEGQVTAFVPVPAGIGVTGHGRAAVALLPAAELAVAVHRGDWTDVDRTYGALGMYVAEREIGVDGPIREYYTVTVGAEADQTEARTEVCWPVFHTRTPQ
jgi:DNA-binding transcriptional MerR regulator